MQKLVKIVEQRQLQERSFPLQDGSTKVLKFVELVLTDGIDTFVAEAYDNLAESINKEPLNKASLFGVLCKMQVRTADARVFNSIRVHSIIPVYESQVF